jgi:AbrB family looped-hinge helix DNA binding protein
MALPDNDSHEPGGVRSVKESVAVITTRGRVTIPAKVREALGVKPGDAVAFGLPEHATGAVTMRRVGSVVERTAGNFRSPSPPWSAQEERAAAEQAWADDAMERMTRQGDGIGG